MLLHILFFFLHTTCEIACHRQPPIRGGNTVSVAKSVLPTLVLSAVFATGQVNIFCVHLSVSCSSQIFNKIWLFYRYPIHNALVGILIAGRNYSNATYFSPGEYGVNVGGFLQCGWHGGSWPSSLELVESMTVFSLSTFHDCSDIAVGGGVATSRLLQKSWRVENNLSSTVT